MSLCAKEGACLEQCARIAAAACQQAERRCRRSGPGRKPEAPDWLVAAMIVVAVLHRRKTRIAQYRFWQARAREFAQLFPDQRPLKRSQFYERAYQLATLLNLAMEALGKHAVKQGWADVRSVALDKSLIAARGRKRHSRDRRRRRGVDPDATWGYSKHDGWVFGYSYEVAVSAGKRGTLWPLLASCDTASRSEQKSCLEKLDRLPKQTRYVLADAGYDSNAVGERVEMKLPGRRSKRRFLCPEISRPQCGKPRQPHSRETKERQRHRRFREARRRFRQSPYGRRLYRRRSVTVERFNSHFKHLFELNDRAWHRGLPNNRASILAAFVAYQVLLTYIHRKRGRHAHLQPLLDGW